MPAEFVCVTTGNMGRRHAIPRAVTMPRSSSSCRQTFPPGSVKHRHGARGRARDTAACSRPARAPISRLVKVSGATYRMLTEPAVLSAGLAGEQLGRGDRVHVRNPAVSSGGIVSNIVQSGPAPSMPSPA